MTDATTTSTASVRVVLIGPAGAGKTALAAALTSGQSVKGQLASFKATGEASRHMLRVPVQAEEGKALIVEVALTDLPGAPDKLSAALAKDNKLLMEADLAVLCIAPTDKNQYVAAVKALDTFKAQSKAGKALVYLTKSDATKEIDGRTVKNLRQWVQVPERDRVVRIETISTVDTDPAQISTLLKALALDAYLAAQARKAAEAEELKQKQAAAAAKTCCVIA